MKSANWLCNRVILGNKMFFDKPYFDARFVNQNTEMLTPIKLVKGEAECIRQREKAYRDLLGAAVSKVRQPAHRYGHAWLTDGSCHPPR